MKVGSGYIGLGTGAYFSEVGNDVMRFDITSNDINNPKKSYKTHLRTKPKRNNHPKYEKRTITFHD